MKPPPSLKEANRLLWDLPSYTSLKAASTGFSLGSSAHEPVPKLWFFYSSLLSGGQGESRGIQRRAGVCSAILSGSFGESS